MAETIKIIGRTVVVDFPEWDLFGIEAKVDTGAYTSSLHCHHIETFKKGRKKYVRFNLLDPSHEVYNEKLFELPVFKTKTVKSSNGASEKRFLVKTLARIMGRDFETELSLTDRSEMRYPILIGRKLIKGNFLVDVSHSHRSRKKSNKQ